MDRKEFLKTACGLGACGCALAMLGVPEPARSEDAAPVDQQLAFVRYQVAKLVGFMAAGATAEACTEVLEKTGRECAKVGQLGARFKGDPQGYFAAAHKAWGTDFTFDEGKGVITAAVAEGECACPLVDPKRTPAAWCSCTVGYMKETFETIFGRPVRATLKESKLAGAKRCVCEVTLS